MDFKVAQPIAGSRGSHTSMTSATFAPYADLQPGDLTFTSGKSLCALGNPVVL
jgi:hypothetical protein